MRKYIRFGLLPAVLALASPVASLHFSRADEPEAKKVEAEYEQRFDSEVREDLFAGFEGDKEALKTGMDKCKAVLKENPQHAEALVWLGGAEIYLSGKSFSKGDIVNGTKYWTEGLKKMDKAKELEPENIGVLIPRAAVLLPAGRNAPAMMAKPVLKRVREDFEQAYARQKDFLDKLGEHPHGELRMGLADVYRLLGKNEKSKENLEAVIKELPGSEYAKEASVWLKAPAGKKLAHNCIGCHSE